MRKGTRNTAEARIEIAHANLDVFFETHPAGAGDEAWRAFMLSCEEVRQCQKRDAMESKS